MKINFYKDKKDVTTKRIQTDNLYRVYDFSSNSFGNILIELKYIEKLRNKNILDYPTNKKIYKNILKIASECETTDSAYNFNVFHDRICLGYFMRYIKENFQEFEEYLNNLEEGNTVKVVIELE